MEENGFVCPRCGNTDLRYEGHDFSGRAYCRKCLEFSGRQAPPYRRIGPAPALCLAYELTNAQKEISAKILAAASQGTAVLVNAVTGAGKTELVYETMAWFMARGKSVGFASPRHDVVLELKPRIEAAFPQAHVVAVCHGHTDDLAGDIVVLTAHQLYRYKNYFDFLVFDEIDAFPYAGNEMLRRFFAAAARGSYVLMSATPDSEDIARIKGEGGIILHLGVRYHGKAMPVPECIRCRASVWLCALRELKNLRGRGFPVFVFVPTIRKARDLALFLRLFVPNGSSVDSKDPDRDRKIKAFKDGELDYLVTTSVLERGITVKDLQVLVIEADNILYDVAALIQIAGRAGRKKGHENGKVAFLAREITPAMTAAVKEIENENHKALLQGVL